jgi:hypothetical protein
MEKIKEFFSIERFKRIEIKSIIQAMLVIVFGYYVANGGLAIIPITDPIYNHTIELYKNTILIIINFGIVTMCILSLISCLLKNRINHYEKMTKHT